MVIGVIIVFFSCNENAIQSMKKESVAVWGELLKPVLVQNGNNT